MKNQNPPFWKMDGKTLEYWLLGIWTSAFTLDMADYEDFHNCLLDSRVIPANTPFIRYINAKGMICRYSAKLDRFHKTDLLICRPADRTFSCFDISLREKTDSTCLIRPVEGDTYGSLAEKAISSYEDYKQKAY